MKKMIAMIAAAAVFGGFADVSPDRDGDQMEDALESAYFGGDADTARYDAHIDSHEDGWSNAAELRARSLAQREKRTYAGLPSPEVTATFRYNGFKDLTGVTLRVEAYSEPSAAKCDAVFLVPWGSNRSVNRVTLPAPSSGWLREGTNMFVVTAGGGHDIMGVARCDVGWSKAAFEVELTEHSPICPRPTILGVASDTSKVYVYRYAVDNESAPRNFASSLVLSKDVGDRSYLHEGDFLSDTEFDVDWELFKREVVGNNGFGYPLTSVTYRVYFEPVDVRLPAVQTNPALPYVAFARKFGASRATAVPVSPGDDSTIFYGARPKFRWRMNGAMSDSFTAFAIQVTNTSGVVWSSGTRVAPPRNSRGEYVWEAPLYVGDQAAAGKVFANSNNYFWTATMYNSKYQTAAWSSNRAFRVAVPVGEIDGVNAYSLNVAVAYSGAGSISATASQTNGAIRVEAFASPDFSGDPAGRAFVQSLSGTTNATIIGLAADTYYVRAYIDSNGDFKRSAWESWGYARLGSDAQDGMAFAPARFTVGAGAAVPTATVTIFDCDTDQDGQPDVREYDTAGANKTDFLLRSSGG